MAAVSSSARLSTGETVFEYDVFLSFYGKDTRLGFTDHLYRALLRNGIRAFRDSEGLQSGEKIGQLFTMIERSQIFVPIFSKNYANSEWCLKEMEKIVKVAGEGEERRLILPVFYRMEPTHLRHQTGPFETAFQNYDKEMDEKTVKDWREALQKAADISGYESDKLFDGYESPLVDLIVRRVLQQLSYSISEDGVVEHLVGMKSRVREILNVLHLQSRDARLVGIHGMGGIGKTTVARAVYKQICRRFDSHCFVGDIRERSLGSQGMDSLKRQLEQEICRQPNTMSLPLDRILANKKVLIVLDDAVSVEQVQALAGKREWFYPGSRIIITTNDEAVLLDLHGWERHREIYRVPELNDAESLELFSWHAFRQGSPEGSFEELSLRAVTALHGLPLAIKTVASALYDNREPNDWDEKIRTLNKRGPGDDLIHRSLRVSYDQLSDNEQRTIFLDVACLLSGIDREAATYVWRACGFASGLSIKALERKSLVKFNDGKLETHRLLREMGRRIVEEELGTGPEFRSRLWKQREVMDVVKKQKGTSKIEGISLTHSRSEEHGEIPHASSDERRRPDEERIVVDAAGFASMDNLRLLMMNHVNLEGRYRNMPKRIKWLQWRRCPLKSLPPDLYLKEVASLDLSYSDITEVKSKQEVSWRSYKPSCMSVGKGMRAGVVFEKMKFLDLTACNKLRVTPDLSAFPNLEKLVLDDCDNLVEIHDSIACLRKLVVWSMCDCKKLEVLPDRISGMTSLKQLDLMNCISFRGRVPMNQMISLEKLNLRNCPVQGLQE